MHHHPARLNSLARYLRAQGSTLTETDPALRACAHRVGLKPNTLWYYVHARRAPGRTTALRMARLLPEVDVAELIGLAPGQPLKPRTRIVSKASLRKR